MDKIKTENKFALTYLTAAALLTLFFGVGQLLGFREQVSILADPFASGGGHQFFGIYYVLTWLGLVVAAPILAGAAILSFIAGLVRGR